ncbi:MAG: beta-N-acetylhexosaminidase [Candidatus Pacebacteria bacterium]|nr:beta-N-acetylhexosaminidase [Candidatus Paceibacterota bacterium]
MVSGREPLAAIIGISGLSLTAEETDLLRQYQPLGVILFARNVRDRGQVKSLTEAIRAALGRDDAPILIDQEGGRVQRLKPPEWSAYPPLAEVGKIYDQNPKHGLDVSELLGLAIGNDLSMIGINLVCAPVLDLRHEGAHSVIGDRAFHSDPRIVTELAAAMIRGFRSAGVTAIIKHIPGHGRATADSHHDLPRVDTARAILEETDFYPFSNLGFRDKLWAMTAHIVYSAIDETVLTLSRTAIDSVIRQGMLFDGVLISDDIGMKALKGSLGDLTRETLAAGCDIVLQCSGKFEDSQQVLKAASQLGKDTQTRLQASQIAWPLQGLNIPSSETMARLEYYLHQYRISLNPQSKDPTA